MIVEGGELRQLSVSQVDTFDPSRESGCELRWWFERTKDLRPDQTQAQSDGEKGHELLANYLRGRGEPEGRVKYGKAVRAVILKGDLPAPGPDLFVEERFSGQPKLDAEGRWVPLDVSKTLWLGGLPWEGFIDLSFRRGDVPEVWDHKFTSDLSRARAPSDLLKSAQLPVYVIALMRRWPDALRWRVALHYVASTGTESKVVPAVVSVSQVLEQKARIEALVERMKKVASLSREADVPFNKRACETFLGCPHQSICSAYKQRKVAMTEAEKALFDDLDAPPAPKPAPSLDDPFTETPAPAAATTTATSPPAPAEDDEEAALERKLAEAKAKKAAAKAQAEAEAAAKVKAEADAAAARAMAAAATAPQAEKPRKLVATPANERRTCEECGENYAVADGHPKCLEYAMGGAVLPPDAPGSQTAIASEQPAPHAAQKRGKAAAAAPAVPSTVTIELGPNTLAALVAALKR